jgi:hypothetical protein
MKKRAAIIAGVCLAIASVSSRMAGIKVGDSDTAFVVILALSAVVNAVMIFAAARRLNRN